MNYCEEVEATSKTIVVTAHLVSVVNGTDNEDVVSGKLWDDEYLTKKISLVSPNVSGARDLIESGAIAFENDTATITIDATGLCQGTHRLCIELEYGTNAKMNYGIDIIVPNTGLNDETQSVEVYVHDVITAGDGAGEQITIDAEPTENSENAVSSGGVYTALAGKADASETELALAGKADGSIYRVGTSGDPAVQDVAKVYGHSVELSNDAVATGQKAVAEGIGTKAIGDNQHVCGKYNVEDTDGDYALIVGNGSDDEHRSNAFAIDWSGNLVLFNNGTPVVLAPDALAVMIASANI